jgi:hypothetical protein
VGARRRTSAGLRVPACECNLGPFAVLHSIDTASITENSLQKHVASAYFSILFRRSSGTSPLSAPDTSKGGLLAPHSALPCHSANFLLSRPYRCCVSMLCKTAKGPKLHSQARHPQACRRTSAGRPPQNALFARRRALMLGGAQVRRRLSHHWHPHVPG